MKIELLSPAKDLECGIAAIEYGADAVYIGASKFGARYNAANNIESIERLISYAHKFNVRVYPVINTLLYNSELQEAERLIHDLHRICADAIIIQDMGILEMNLPPIPLFASTQTHNYSLEKIRFLEKTGIKRVILARELSLNQIQHIRANTSLELETFIHGALCVSFSGQCYFSEAITHRSANRGMCSQPCRMRYDLIEENGKIIIKDKHLLSLKDLNLSEYLGQLIDAGICSFKIEGRLKDQSYVKNITAFYRQNLDKILESKTGFQKSSSGKTDFNFEPNPDKSFNRSFTTYYINNSRRNHVASINTEKSIGEEIGKVKNTFSDYFFIDTEKVLNNGDGICFFENGLLLGTNVNKVIGGKIYPNNMSGIKNGAIIYRNNDIEFNKFLDRNKIKRRVLVDFSLEFFKPSLLLTAIDEDKNTYTHSLSFDLPDNTDYSEASKSRIIQQLGKTGNSIFELRNIEISKEIKFLIPLSILNQLRREVTDGLENIRVNNYKREEINIIPNDIPYPEKELDYRANITNDYSSNFYSRHGVMKIEQGFELESKRNGKTIMTTKYCIRFEIGKCPVANNEHTNNPLFLINNKNRYRLEFDCKECIMKIILC